ncbi:MAG TPA: hypothetical protein VE972_07750 [Conexibacter sp.]|nr:hypothetical protein [Conexibacter sp.]
MQAKLIVIVLSICCGLSLLAAAPAGAAQRIDLKVLLLGANGTEPSFSAWQAQLKREGVPFDQLVATSGHTPITPESLSTTLPEGTQEARYQAVIVATGGLPRCDEEGVCASALAPEEWTALQSFEQTFNVRQVTAYTFPSPEVGLNPPTFAGPLDGVDATLTPAGQSAFPYLKGTVTIGAGTWGYEATPIEAASYSTLLTDPDGASLVGVFTHPDGRQELVQTFDSNSFQIHSQLLRHGELAWVTRGTYFGDQRNYLEMHIDDVFLGDDIWDPVNHVTDFNPADAVRMTAADVTKAVEWSRANGLRIDNLFNGGGSVAAAEANGGSDPLLAAFQANKTAFNWISHTYDHPNLDCSTRAFIDSEITDNVNWATTTGIPTVASELVTGEHSGLANLIPGSPGTIDPPSIDEAAPVARNGTLAAGLYEYGITATSPNGETVAATTTARVPVGERGITRGSTVLEWDAICKATGYRIYRRSLPDGAWAMIGTVAQPANPARDTGPTILRYRDAGAAGSTTDPPSVNTAKIGPYGQNPNFSNAIRDTGVRYLGADASKPYPVTPTSTTGPVWPAGAQFIDGTARVFPRHPTNVYYNVATRAQELDEYNFLYLPPSLGGGCVESPTNTCRTSPATWEDVVAAESQRIFGLMMGNDPRPHYFHQTNLAESDQAEGAVFYPVLDAALATYNRYFNSSAPIVQLLPTALAVLLGRQDAWATASTGSVVGYVEGSRVTVVNRTAAAVQAPITGTEAGTVYGGSRSGWVGFAAGTSTRRAAVAWPAPPPPPPPAPLAAPLDVVAGVEHADTVSK